MRVIVLLLAVLSLLPAAVPVRGQSERPEQPASAHSSYFSGYVAELSAQNLTVSRKGPNKETVSRVFVITSQTKIEGKLRVSARVTVRYELGPEGNHAIRIIVR